MISVVNRLLGRPGAADRIVERFASSGGYVQNFPGFVSMEVLKSSERNEVLVVTRWQDRDSFDSWVQSDEFSRAHGRGDSEGLLRGRPEVSVYEIAVERDAG